VRSFNKRGTGTDVLYLVVVLFFIGFFCFVGYFTFNRMNTLLLANSVMNSTQASRDALGSITTTTSKYDYFVLAVFIGFVLAILISSWFIGGNPLFMILYFVVLVGCVVGSMFLSNIWEEVTQKAIWGATITGFPITNHLITYMPVYIAVVGFLGMIAMFGKPYLMGGGDGY